MVLVRLFGPTSNTQGVYLFRRRVALAGATFFEDGAGAAFKKPRGARDAPPFLKTVGDFHGDFAFMEEFAVFAGGGESTLETFIVLGLFAFNKSTGADPLPPRNEADVDPRSLGAFKSMFILPNPLAGEALPVDAVLRSTGFGFLAVLNIPNRPAPQPGVFGGVLVGSLPEGESDIMFLER
jgi:hypothetical protein